MRRFIVSTAFLLAALLTSASLSARPRALVDVNAVDRETGRVLPVYWGEGQAFVAGAPGHRYSIRVRNLTGERLLAVVSVDGVNVVSGQTASTDQGGYVLSPWQQQDIDGWRKSMSEVAAFEFTSLGNSYAARTGRPGNVGVIGVAVFREREAWRPYSRIGGNDSRDDRRYRPQAKAESESRAEGRADSQADAAAPGAEKRAGSSSSYNGIARSPMPGTPLGTGHGEREYDSARQVRFERASSQPEQVVSVRYDSYRNLVALGVIVEPRGPRYGRPDPFPAAFVPDPPRYYRY